MIHNLDMLNREKKRKTKDNSCLVNKVRKAIILKI